MSGNNQLNPVYIFLTQKNSYVLDYTGNKGKTLSSDQKRKQETWENPGGLHHLLADGVIIRSQSLQPHGK